MGKPDVTYECHEADTSYRLAPNPDAPPGAGFSHGATLFHDDGSGNWVLKTQFFIAPEALEALGLALLEAAKDVKS